MVAHTIQHTDAGMTPNSPAPTEQPPANTLTAGTTAEAGTTGAAGDHDRGVGDPALVRTGGAGDGTVCNNGNVSNNVFTTTRR